MCIILDLGIATMHDEGWVLEKPLGGSTWLQIVFRVLGSLVMGSNTNVS